MVKRRVSYIAAGVIALSSILYSGCGPDQANNSPHAVDPYQKTYFSSIDERMKIWVWDADTNTSVAVGDMDNDGDLDIIVANSRTKDIRIYENRIPRLNNVEAN